MSRPIEEVEKDLREAVRYSFDLIGETNRSAEQSLRAQRWAGELLIELGFGGHGGDRRSSCSVQLEALGVTKTHSHRWRLLASLGDDEFEKYIDGAKERQDELTVAGALKLAKRLRATQLSSDDSSPPGS